MLGKDVIELCNHLVSAFNAGQYVEFLTLGQYLETGKPRLVAGEISTVFVAVWGRALLLPQDLRRAVWADVVRVIEEGHNKSAGVPAYKRVVFQHIVDSMHDYTAGLDDVSGTAVGFTASILDSAYRDTGLFGVSPLSFADNSTCDVLSSWLSMLHILVRGESDASVFLNMLQARFGGRL